MTNKQATLLAGLELAAKPVAVAFLAEPPSGLSRINPAQPASCGYWRRASEGESFYTTAEDHTNCPIGAFTHGVSLSAPKTKELHSLIGMMVELKYLKGEEVPSIPHRSSPMKIAAYAPLAETTFTPDLVIFRGNARQIMLLSEAARAAGAFDGGTVMGRPACSMLPQATAAETAVASIGCIGNRVYTGLGDGELYISVPGSKVDRLLNELESILTANSELEKFHKERAAGGNAS
jgi:uncharacterized protein (DUF169 family)